MAETTNSESVRIEHDYSRKSVAVKAGHDWSDFTTSTDMIREDADVSDSAPLMISNAKPESSSRMAAIGEKIRDSRLGQLIDSFALQDKSGASHGQLMLANHDLKPVEPARRQWKARNFVAFWIADSFNVNTWMIASASIIDGLAWYQAWICVWIGCAIAACFIVLTGRIGAIYHISFPVVNRASFGIWGSLWPVLNRAMMACVWYGVQSWIGGTCVGLMIRSIWPSWLDYETDDTRNTPASMHASTEANARDFFSFFAFWIGSLPFLWIPVHKIRYLFTVKSIVAPSAGVALFIWAILKAGGIGPIIHKPAEKTGSALAWAMIKAVMSSIANFATLIVNEPDFARFARQPRDALWSQLLTIPCGFAFTSFIGIIVSSSSTVSFGQTVWSPLSLLALFLEDENNPTSAVRFGVFVIAASFSLAQLGTNISANSISAGTDLAALLPKYLNIRRGSYICAVVGLIIMPWRFFASSNRFTTYLSAYSVFLSSIAGVMICDYYVVRKGYLETRNLYSALRTGPYWYTWGINWRGYTAYICGILINVVGFAGAIGVAVPKGATYIYNLNFFCGFVVSSGIYWFLCRISKPLATSSRWREIAENTSETDSSPSYEMDIFDSGSRADETNEEMVAGKGPQQPLLKA